MNQLQYKDGNDNSVSRLRDFLLHLENCSKNIGTDITVNRMYTFDKEIKLNVSINNKMFLLNIGKDMCIVSSLNKQNTKREQHTFDLTHIVNGSFLEKFG